MTSTTTPYYPQLAERDCAATCLRMVAEHFGVRASMTRLRELTATTDDGTDLGGIEAGARAMGFETLAAELPYDELAAGDLLPAILHWDRDHFVVVASADRYSANVLDPATGARRLKRSEFEAHRHGPGRSRAGLVIRPAPGAEHLLSGGEGDRPPAPQASGRVTSEPALPSTAQPTSTSPAPTALPIALAAGLLTVAFTGLGYVFVEATYQAVDLQFREQWVRQLGSLLLAAAAVGLARYLLFRACLRYASARAGVDAHAIAAVNLNASVLADARQRERAREDAEGLIIDSELVRNWFAYDSPVLFATPCAMAAGLILLLYVDWPLALVLTLGTALTVAVWAGLRGRGTANRVEAEHARALRLEAEREHTDTAGVAQSLDAGDWLDDRLQRARARANVAYGKVASEYNAQKQLVSGAAGLAVVAVAAFGLYRLGFAELQVGSLTAVVIIAALVAQRLNPSLELAARWMRQRPSRLRLDEARGVARARPRERRVGAPHGGQLVFQAERAREIVVDLPAFVALVGPDDATRAELISGLLSGRRGSKVPGTLALQRGVERLEDLTTVGRVAVVREGDPLVDASLAENISLSARPDPHRLHEAATVVGLDGNAFPHGLASRLVEIPEPVRLATKLRVLVARGIYAGVDIIVLDGATERLTDYDEGVLLDALLAWGVGKTIVYSSSRSLSAYGFDVIAYVAAGELESVGSHQELMHARGAYYYEVIARNSRKA